MEDRYIHEMARLERTNFWFKAKRRLVDFWVKEDGLIVEMGCGTGSNLLLYKQRGCNVLGVDRSDASIACCNQAGINAVKKDLAAEPLEMTEKARYIFALDFIEHLRDPEVFLERLMDISTDKTELIISVPAHQYLFSSWDKKMQHYRRYSKSLLTNQLKNAGWTINEMTYSHALLFLPSILMRKLKPQKEEDLEESFFHPPRVINELLYLCYFPEFLFRNLGIPIPFGLSLMAKATPTGVKPL